MSNFGFLIIVVAGLCFYFIPARVGGGKRNEMAIFWLNLLLGWTVIGWVVALVWATTKDEEAVASSGTVTAEKALPPSNVDYQVRVNRLRELRDNGTLTQSEFMEQVGRL